MRVGSGAGVVQKQQQQGGCCAGGGCCEPPAEVKSKRDMAEARKVEEACKAKEVERGLAREREREEEEEAEAEDVDVDVMLKQHEDLLSSMFDEVSKDVGDVRSRL